jgi:hypothetical protein
MKMWQVFHQNVSFVVCSTLFSTFIQTTLAKLILHLTHHNGILFNDLFKDNIMLQFMPHNPYDVYIGMCD